MGPKKKGKKGKEKKQETDTMTAVDRTFYELTITDLNNKLARLRTHCAKLEGSNEEIQEKIRAFEEDRTDVTAYLDRQLAEKIDIIKEMDERLVELAKVREEENKASAEKIKEWESKYKAMHEQLTSEIKLLNGKLNSLEEFRVQRSDLLMKFDEQEAQMKEQRRLQEEKIHEMEQQAIIEKDQLKKDVEAKLLQLSEDFTKSSEIRIAGYTRRLIRENIALNKEMDRMIKSQIRMEQENKQMKERATEIEQLYASSETVKQRMVKTCQNQIEIIEKLTNQYEVLQTKYERITHYKKLYETSLKRDICERFSYNEMSKKMRIFAQRVEMLKSDKQKLISFHQKHEDEIIRLNDILKTIKFTVQSAIRGELDDSDDPRFRAMERKNLLTELMQVLTTYTEDTAFTPSKSSISSEKSIYRPGTAGLMPKAAASLLELFKREAKKIAAAELIAPAFMPRTYDGRITPKPQELAEDTLIDIQSGTTIVFSTTSHEEEEAPPDDAALDDEQDAGVSSSSESVAPKTEPAPAAAKVKDKPPKEAERTEVPPVKEEAPVEKKESVISKLGEEEHAKTPRSGESLGEETVSYIDALVEAEEEEDEAGYFFY